MCIRTIRTVSRAAVACCLVILCANCREKNPTESEASRRCTPSLAAAPAPLDAQPLEPSDSPWWHEGPQWYRALSSDARAAIDNADRSMEEALEIWGKGELNRARDGILEAERVYAQDLGNAHWKTWDCQLHRNLIQAEQAWTDQDMERARELGLEHLVMGKVEHALYEARKTTVGDRAEAVNAVYQFLNDTVDSRLHGYFQAYQQRYHALIARDKHEYAAAQMHFEASLRSLENLIQFAHPLKAQTHRDIIYELLYQFASSRVCVEDVRDLGRMHLCASLQMLRDCVPVDSTYARQWLAALHSGGQWLRKEERFGEAKLLYSAAAVICHRFLPESHEYLTILLLDLAELCNTVGDGYGALLILEEIEKEMPETLDRADRKSRFLTESGFARLELGEYEQACADFQDALAVWSDQKGRDRGRVLYFYGAALTKSGQFADAIIQYENAVAATGRERTRVLAALFELRARIFELAGRKDPDGLRVLADRLGQTAGDLGSAGEARRHRLLAYARLLLEQPGQAMQSLKTAADFYEVARSAGHLLPLDLGPWHENESPYLLGAICELRLRDWNAAFEWLERHSGQVLGTLTRNSEAGAAGWGDILSALAPIKGGDRAQTRPSQGLNTATISASNPSVMSQISEDLLVDRGVAVLGWVDDIPEPGRRALPDRWVFVLRKSGAKAKLEFARLDEHAIPPQDVINSLNGNAERTKWRALAYGFYKQRLAPIMPHLQEIDRLYVLSRGVMLGFPVEALPMDDPEEHPRPRLFGDRFAVAYGPSCSVLSHLVNRRKAKAADQYCVLAIGDPGTPRVPLPASGIEAETVAGYFSGRARVLLGKNATERVLHMMNSGGGRESSLLKYSHLHFAVHGEANVLSPDGCYLELTRRSDLHAGRPSFLAEVYKDDGALRFQELMELRLGASLVVLSACETGLGRPLESEGYLGLPQAFFHAGARALITTLWGVEDVSAAMLMDRFYSNLVERGMGEAQALQDAKRYLRRQTWRNVVDWCEQHGAASLVEIRAQNDDLAYDHPEFWASYVLMGPHD